MQLYLYKWWLYSCITLVMVTFVMVTFVMVTLVHTRRDLTRTPTHTDANGAERTRRGRYRGGPSAARVPRRLYSADSPSSPSPTPPPRAKTDPVHPSAEGRKCGGKRAKSFENYSARDTTNRGDASQFRFNRFSARHLRSHSPSDGCVPLTTNHLELDA
jgi:hypothetical protein